jgi:hypothetical protein
MNDMTVHNRIVSEKIFFYCRPTGRRENTSYHHQIICLAEGFKGFGIPCFSNINYWQISPGEDDHLIIHDPEITLDDCFLREALSCKLRAAMPFDHRAERPKQQS